MAYARVGHPQRYGNGHALIRLWWLPAAIRKRADLRPGEPGLPRMADSSPCGGALSNVTVLDQCKVVALLNTADGGRVTDLNGVLFWSRVSRRLQPFGGETDPRPVVSITSSGVSAPSPVGYTSRV